MNLIDTLVNLETEFGDVWISKDLGAQIIAALKAGQGLRDSTANSQLNQRLLFDSLVAWDKATKR